MLYTNFWETIGNWFVNLFKNIGDWFMDRGTDGKDISNLGRILLVLVIIVAASFVAKLLGFLLKKLLHVNPKKGPQLDLSAKMFLVNVIKALFWLFIAFTVISVLGIDITGFAGVLSAVTVALGLALQDLISSFASGLLIINQRNILSGDYIQVTNAYGSVEGTVMDVRLFCTVLKTFSGQKVVIPNSNVTGSNIVNYSHYPSRRMCVNVQCAYESDPELVKNVLLKILKEDKRVLSDPEPLVHVDAFNDVSMVFACKAWINNDDYWDVVNGFREQVLLAFRENGIKIPLITHLNVTEGNPGQPS